MKIKKPDFTEGGGFVVDPEFLPKDVHARCCDSLRKSRLSHEQITELLEFASKEAQYQLRDVIAYSQQKKQLEALGEAAHALLVAINKMHFETKQMFHAHAHYLAEKTPDPGQPLAYPPRVLRSIRNSGGQEQILESAWDWVDALETGAQYAASQFTYDRQSKPREIMARQYVASLADCIEKMTGERPPKDPASWFQEFVDCLVKDHFDLPSGNRIVRGAIAP